MMNWRNIRWRSMTELLVFNREEKEFVMTVSFSYFIFYQFDVHFVILCRLAREADAGRLERL